MTSQSHSQSGISDSKPPLLSSLSLFLSPPLACCSQHHHTLEHWPKNDVKSLLLITRLQQRCLIFQSTCLDGTLFTRPVSITLALSHPPLQRLQMSHGVRLGSLSVLCAIMVCLILLFKRRVMVSSLTPCGQHSAVVEMLI